MKLKLSSTNGLIVGMVAFAVLAFFFWTLMLGPKRDEADHLSAKAKSLESSLATHESEISQALEARASYPEDYRNLVVLGKAVPGDDDTASFLVQLDRISKSAGVEFRNLKLSTTGEAAPEEAATTAPPVEGASPTEVAASTLPLGATIGTAGLGVMPYELNFKGNFFTIAKFIHGLDALVRTENEKVAVTGRLITINGFALKGDTGKGFPALEGSFSVTTYLTPPELGVTGGAAPSGPAEATQVSATVGATP
jgi:Tfp pilus assembly protein PilO